MATTDKPRIIELSSGYKLSTNLETGMVVIEGDDGHTNVTILELPPIDAIAFGVALIATAR